MFVVVVLVVVVVAVFAVGFGGSVVLFLCDVYTAGDPGASRCTLLSTHLHASYRSHRS